MPKRRKPIIRLTRLEARTRVIDGVGRMAFVGFCIAFGFVVVATAFPQRRVVERLEARLQVAKEREAMVLADREYRRVEHRALQEDPAFLELHARDRLNYYREGERVLKFKDDL